MKHIKYSIVIILLFYNIAVAQDFETDQHYFNYNGQDSVLLSNQLDDFKQTEFLLGWQWGSSRNTAPPQTFLHFGELK